MSATGGMGRCATVFYKRLAAMIAEKRNIAYNRIISVIICRLSFALLRSSILYLRGARSSYHRVRNDPYEMIIKSRFNCMFLSESVFVHVYYYHIILRLYSVYPHSFLIIDLTIIIIITILCTYKLLIRIAVRSIAEIGHAYD